MRPAARGDETVDFENFLKTALWAFSVVLASSAIALGQTGPAARTVATANEEGSLPLVPEATADPSPGAGWGEAVSRRSCCSRWTASADFIILDRVGSAPYPLVETIPGSVSLHDLPTTAGTTMLNAADLHLGFSGGPRLGLTHHGDDGSDLEVSYFQIDGWGSAKGIGPILSDGQTDWLVMRAPGNFLQTQQSHDQMMAWDYASRLYNAEMNVRWHPWPRVTVLAGFRWVNLTEELEGILIPPTPHGTGSFWDAQTKNNLYGLQIGADARFLELGRFSIDGLLKAGIFDNHADAAALVRMERIQFGESDTADYPAFLGELGVRCEYRVTPRLSLKAGYQAIWLQGVALAPGQISETSCHGADLPQDIYVQALGVNCSSGIVFHGATAGLEYSF
jgi:hypothetical protein